MVGPFSGEVVAQYYDIPFWNALPNDQRALFRMAYAADVAHVEEEPLYSNSGPEVDRALASCGIGPGEPWCAAYWSCMLLDSGVSRDALPSEAASVHGWLSWALANGRSTSPARGRAGLIIETPTSGHLVVVSEVVGTSVHTIEGNTNPGGSRDGYGVFRRVRPISEFRTFVDCSGL